jgi:beta-lactamase superfamily II metal-dependent hydrolase
MINVGQGDSFLIQDKDKNMAIDSYNNVDYIKNRGIENLDILLITHSDKDHISSAVQLVKDIKVNTLILNKYEDSEIIDEIKPHVKKILYLSKGDVFYFNSHLCNVYGPLDNIDKNNNSLVFDINLNEISFLFTGDMEEKEENIIFDEYLQYDFLKVPHHGSNSSMKQNFLKYVNFKYALISVGINNKYNHPSVETINKLDLDKTYMTSKSNSVVIYLTKYNYYIYESIRKRLILNVLDMI